MADITALPVANYAAGPYPINSTAIGDGVTSLQLAVQNCTTGDTTIWPNAGDTITFDLQVSVDNGVKWQQWFNASNGGGIHVNGKTGQEIPLMYVQGSLPAGTGRRIKGTVTLSAPIRTGATLTVL